MTGQDIQDVLDRIVSDLQTEHKGKTTHIMLRAEDGTPVVLPLSSDVNGVVNAGQLAAIQTFLGDVKTYADDYETAYAPVKTASESFKTAREVHQVLIDEAAAARTALADALEADANYQAAKTAYDGAREDAAYIAARTNYKTFNVSENFGNLQEARGKYIE